MATKEKKTRVQFDLLPRPMALLISLKERTDAGTYGEVFRAAMRCYDRHLSETEPASTEPDKEAV